MLNLIAVGKTVRASYTYRDPPEILGASRPVFQARCSLNFVHIVRIVRLILHFILCNWFCFITAFNIVTVCAWHAWLKGYLSYLILSHSILSEWRESIWYYDLLITFHSYHGPILVPFSRFARCDQCKFFWIYVYFNVRRGASSCWNWIIPETLKKLDSWDYQSVQKTHDMLSWFDRIHKRDRQT